MSDNFILYLKHNNENKIISKNLLNFENYIKFLCHL